MAVPATINRLLVLQPIDIPVFHPIALRMVHLLADANFVIDDLVSTANDDQVLAGLILKMANSHVYSGRVKIETIKDALVRLGAYHVSNLAMASSQASLHASQNDFVNAEATAKLALAATAAGGTPNRGALEIILASQLRQKRQDDAVKTLETVVTYYDEPDEWGQIISFSLGTKGIKDLDALDIESAAGECFGHRGRRGVELHPLVKPGDRELHQNCSRKRRSFSRNRRISGMP